MKSSDPEFRHEQKYLISNLEKDILVKRMDAFMQRDAYASNGRYMIRSLYFDDFTNSAYMEKLGGATTRKKYRIRCYDYSDSIIKLECKHKQERYIYIRKLLLSRCKNCRRFCKDNLIFFWRRRIPYSKIFI